jgi:hypothetical protein
VPATWSRADVEWALLYAPEAACAIGTQGIRGVLQEFCNGWYAGGDISTHLWHMCLVRSARQAHAMAHVRT